MLKFCKNSKSNTSLFANTEDMIDEVDMSEESDSGGGLVSQNPRRFSEYIIQGSTMLLSL